MQATYCKQKHEGVKERKLFWTGTLPTFFSKVCAPCRLRGWKNWPAPFPGQMP